jgi:D-3-phosphoglycerate dehydrogenase
MKKIAILDTGYPSYDHELHLFGKHGYELIIHDGPDDSDLRIEWAREATGILVRDTLIGEKEMDRMPHLKAIVRYGVGYDNIDIEEARNRGIRVSNVQGYANHAVSDHALALMFSCTRDLAGHRKEKFGKPNREEMFELHNKTLGIIGIGRIGSQFSKKASPLFDRTLAFDPYKTGDYIRECNAEKVELEDLLQRSHIISLHCNLSDETRFLLDKARFEQMAQRPVIINTSRGAVIKEKELLKALDSGLVHSAGLDVFENEPPGPAQEKLLRHPHVIFTPHVAWYSNESIKKLQARAADHMIGLLSGNPVDDEL